MRSAGADPFCSKAKRITLRNEGKAYRALSGRCAHQCSSLTVSTASACGDCNVPVTRTFLPRNFFAREILVNMYAWGLDSSVRKNIWLQSTIVPTTSRRPSPPEALEHPSHNPPSEEVRWRAEGKRKPDCDSLVLFSCSTLRAMASSLPTGAKRLPNRNSLESKRFAAIGCTWSV
jgi:hypothetical protein